jgi:diguanylate cyclase (GGDEF)-like protein
MTEKGGSGASKTVAHAALEQLITPVLDPGKACLIVIRGHSVGQMVDVTSAPAVMGRAPEVELTIDDVAVSRRHARVSRGPDGFLLEDLDSTNGVFVNGLRIRNHTLRDGDRIQVGTTTLVKFCFQDEVEASFQRSLYDSATRDSLTGIYNRGFLMRELEVDFTYARRNGSSLSVLMIDLDHFKRVNDEHGHLAGDAVLKQAADVIQRSLRSEDLFARYGGEEFAALLRFTDGQRAFVVAERIRENFAANRFRYEAVELRLTCSLGLATLQGNTHSSVEELLSAADSFLYRAKQLGRNRTLYVGLEPDPERLTARTLSLRAEDLEGLPTTPSAARRAAGSARPARKAPKDSPSSAKTRSRPRRRR